MIVLLVLLPGVRHLNAEEGSLLSLLVPVLSLFPDWTNSMQTMQTE
jgi:hypothetical protein